MVPKQQEPNIQVCVALDTVGQAQVRDRYVDALYPTCIYVVIFESSLYICVCIGIQVASISYESQKRCI